ncbi:TRAP transporter large permease [Castellaniella denitrificans]|uniref:TRAP transporter large permease protein n=1 Tax=Castellaniella denitrificans TaxID=56119 RepID=A0ABT4M0B8_9BURK|nr:TRAP transporter large permease subunit [Castellaniella denitrificans]MCZ4328761.1 TRAP transporter large permease subunit [Castellaniella denitrificans]
MDTTLIFLAVLFASMAIGIPIAISLLVSGVALMWHLDFFNTQLLAQNLQAGFDSFPLLAVPFFILAGELMNVGGLSQRIIDMARAFVGHIPGGLGYVAVFASVLLASMSGSAIADTAALATILLPMMRQQGYPMNYSTGLLASGGIIGPIIPPSLPFIIYGVTTNTSISKLFISGVAPGVLMGGALLIAWRAVARRRQLPTAPRATSAERRRAVTDSVWAIFMPVIILGGIRFGVFTPTEAAVVAAVYAFVVSRFIYRALSWKAAYDVLVASSITTAVVMFLCGAATVAAYMITLADLPNQLAELFQPILAHPKLFMACMVVFLLLVGTSMDLTPIILIFAPVCLPLALKAHIDPIYFGFMFVFTGCLGLITPPVGTVLNVAAGVGGVKMESVVKGVAPFLLVYALLLVLLVAFPQIVIAPVHWLG